MEVKIQDIVRYFFLFFLESFVFEHQVLFRADFYLFDLGPLGGLEVKI